MKEILKENNYKTKKSKKQGRVENFWTLSKKTSKELHLYI